MSNRGRPVNCHLDHWELTDKLNSWVEDQIKRGNADNFVWDRVWDLDVPDFKHKFGKIVEDLIDMGGFDESVKKRAEIQWGLQA